MENAVPKQPSPNPAPAKPKKEKVKKFRCELCSVRLPYTEASYKEHMEGSHHKGMKLLLDNQLWPGPASAGDGNAYQTKPIMYHVRESGELYCRICRKSCPDAVALLRHQSTIPHLKQMLRNALFTHNVLYFCEGCGEATNLLSVAKVSDHLRSKAHQTAVGSSGWREKMSDWANADLVMQSIFDWKIEELVSVESMEEGMSADEFGVLEVGRKEAWDLPKDPASKTPSIDVEIMYWEHRQTDIIRQSDSDQYEESLRKLDQARGRRVLSHCADVLRYFLRCYPVTNKPEVLVFDPAFFKIYLLGRMSTAAFAVFHRLLTRRLPTRQEGATDLVRFSAKDFTIRSSGASGSGSQEDEDRGSHCPSSRNRGSVDAKLDGARRSSDKRRRLTSDSSSVEGADPVVGGSIPPSPPAQISSQKREGKVTERATSVSSISPNSLCSLWVSN